MEVVRKHALDEQVAELLGKKTSEVSVITAAFLNEARRALVEEGAVRLDGLGALRAVCCSGARHVFNSTSFKGKKSVVAVEAKYYVYFKKAQPLREALLARHGRAAKKETVMEKFGVDESADENLEKEASEGCPACGKKPVRHGNVLMCPEHGSEPFEKKKPA